MPRTSTGPSDTADQPDADHQAPAAEAEAVAPVEIPGLIIAVRFTGQNHDEIELVCKEHYRVTHEGPQICQLTGIDGAFGWLPLHQEHVVCDFNSEPYPVVIGPAIARLLGLG